MFLDMSKHCEAVRSAYYNKRYEEVLRLLSITPHQSVEAEIIETEVLPNSAHSHLVRTHPMHLSAYYGWIDIVKLLISNGYSPTNWDAHYKVPLCYAAMGGHLNIVKYFVEECIDVHRCMFMYNVMDEAAKGGHLEVVKYFVEKHNVSGIRNYNAMCHAVKEGHLEVVKFLVEEYGDHNAMYNAAKRGHLKVVKYLTEECNVCGSYDDMYNAAMEGHLEVVKYLVEKCNVCGDYSAILYDAAIGGHCCVVKYFVKECNVYPHTLDSSMNTILHTLAKCTASYEVVECLVDVCDPMATNSDGDTPILIALQAKNFKIVQCLLKDSNSHPNKYNYPPVHDAVRYNNVPQLQHLIDNEHHDPMCIDGYGRTPLHVACKHGLLTVVKHLLSLPLVDPTCIDKYGNTPLHVACEYDYLNVVQYLLSVPSVDPTCINKCGNTPLHIVCKKSKKLNHDMCLDLLFAFCKKSSNKLYHDDDIAMCLLSTSDPMSINALLHMAFNKHGYLNVVQYLLSLPSVDPMCIDKYGNTPLHMACKHGYLTVVQYLLSLPSVDPTCIDKYGNTPLHVACKHGYFNMVKYLLSLPSVDPMCINKYGNHTPLHMACEHGCLTVIKYLLSLPSVDPMCVDKYDSTPLHWACRYGHLAIVEHLSSLPSIDPMCVDIFGNTPLYWACKFSHFNVVQYLLSIPSVDPLCMNKHGDTPFHHKIFSNKHVLHQLYKVFDKVRVKHSVSSFVNIFLLGHPGAGKTTFAQVIKDRASNFFKFGSVKQVKSPTAGIVPTTLQNTELGNIILHDFAGQPQYYSSHTAVLDNILERSGAIFLLLVNLKEDVLKQIEFWESVILNECSKAFSDCHLVVIGSHADEVSKNELEKKKKEFVQKKWSISFQYLYFLDCRQRSGSELKSIIHTLSNLCASTKNKQKKEISLTCNFLYSVIKDSMAGNFHTLQEVVSACSKAEDLSLSLKAEKGATLVPDDIIPLLKTFTPLVSLSTFTVTLALGLLLTNRFSLLK